MQQIGNTRPRRVLIGTPTFHFSLDSRYVFSLTETLRLAIARGVQLIPVFMEGGAIVQSARNDLVKIALDQAYDDLIFIDADQSWEPEWIMRLLAHPVDCVGAAVRKKNNAEEQYNVKAKGGALSVVADSTTGLLTAPDLALGTGFIRFSRRALQALADSSEKYVTHNGETAWIFDFSIVNRELVGEDTIACEKLRQLGIQTWVDPSMTCNHHDGSMTYSGDFAAWLAAEQLGAVAA